MKSKWRWVLYVVRILKDVVLRRDVKLDELTKGNFRMAIQKGIDIECAVDMTNVTGYVICSSWT